MSVKINLDIQSILNKRFHVDFKGYNADEVDGYLDQVMEDYDTYQTLTKALSDKVAQLEREKASLEARVIELEGKQKVSMDSPNQGVSNIDILKRLSRLEQEVYNK